MTQCDHTPQTRLRGDSSPILGNRPVGILQISLLAPVDVGIATIYQCCTLRRHRQATRCRICEEMHQRVASQLIEAVLLDNRITFGLNRFWI
jgi:hypothetical protein